MISNCYISLRTRIKTALHDKKNSVKELARQHDRIPSPTTEIDVSMTEFPRHDRILLHDRMLHDRILHDRILSRRVLSRSSVDAIFL